MNANANYSVEEKMLDGRSVLIRSIRSTDKAILVNGMRHLTPQSLYYRFLTPKRELTDAELRQFTELDFEKHVGLLAVLRNKDGQIPVAVGRYVQAEHGAPGKSAEVALAVEDKYQNLGIGTFLLKHLCIIARASGIEYFDALVMTDNIKMLNLLKNSGMSFVTKLHTAGVLELKIKLGPSNKIETRETA